MQWLGRIFCQCANGPFPRKTMGHFETKWDIDKLIFHLNCIMAKYDLYYVVYNTCIYKEELQLKFVPRSIISPMTG